MVQESSSARATMQEKVHRLSQIFVKPWPPGPDRAAPDSPCKCPAIAYRAVSGRGPAAAVRATPHSRGPRPLCMEGDHGNGADATAAGTDSAGGRTGPGPGGRL